MYELGVVYRSLQRADRDVAARLGALGSATVHEAMGRGQSLSSAMRNVRVWGKRQPALERAARRIDTRRVLPLLASLARLDALAKGLGRGDPWDAVVAIALSLCEQPAPVEP